MPVDLPPVEDVIALLGLEPHPTEGGRFAETYRSGRLIPQPALPDAYVGERSFSTAIYYLITPDSFSALHLLPGEEVFHFYLGDPVETLLLGPEGGVTLHRLGTDLASGERPQLVVPGGVWQGSRLLPGGRYALLGATMAPGFDFRDYHHGDADVLTARFPEAAHRIRQLL